jgi:hypothetical protein
MAPGDPQDLMASAGVPPDPPAASADTHASPVSATASQMVGAQPSASACSTANVAVSADTAPVSGQRRIGGPAHARQAPQRDRAQDLDGAAGW